MTVSDASPRSAEASARPQSMKGLALDYIRIGWRPIPLCWPSDEGRCGCGQGHTGKAVGKAPLLGKCYQNLLPTESMASHWWTRWPKANIGILLEPSRLLVVDADGAEGVAELNAMRPLPIGPVSSSGGGGQHRWYGAHCGLVGRSIKRGESRCLDVLAAGYIIAPPSRHRSGRPYEWLISPGDAELPAVPVWAADFLAQRAAVRKVAAVCSSSDISQINLASLPLSTRTRALLAVGVNGSTYASRSEALFAAIAALVRAGADDSTVARTIWTSAVGEKAREQGQRWLAEEIARVRAKVAAAPRCSGLRIGVATRPHGADVPPPARPKGTLVINHIAGGSSQ